jgi:hypothetical protein
VTDEGAGIDAGDYGNLESLQIFIGNLMRTPIGANRREFANYEALNIRTPRLVIIRVCAIVADLRVGQHHDLAGIRGIGENLLVSCDGGVEDNLPVTLDPGSIGYATKDAPIF